MKSLEITINPEQQSAMWAYQDDPSQTEVFTYEIGKYFDHIDDWNFDGNTLTISYRGSKPDISDLQDRIVTLCSWQDNQVNESLYRIVKLSNIKKIDN